MTEDSRAGRRAQGRPSDERSLDPARAFADHFRLTVREREVFASLVVGRSQKETAAELGIAESTVRFHALGSYAKCGVRKQREMLAFFVRWLQRSQAAEAADPIRVHPTFRQLERSCERPLESASKRR